MVSGEGKIFGLTGSNHGFARSAGGSSRLWERPWFIFLVALGLRLAVLPFLAGDRLDPARDHWRFAWEVGRIASSLASGRGFSSPLFGQTGPTAWMGPVYPCLLAGVFKIFGIYSSASAYVMLFLSCFFSALTCLLLQFIARRIFGNSTATAAGWMWALFPYSFFFSAGQIWNTTLNALLLTLALAITLSLERNFGVGRWALWAIVWALAGLTEPSLLACLPGCGVWLIFRLRRRGLPWIFFWRTGLAAVVFLIVVSPWFLRNYAVFRRVIPLRSNFWLTFYQGNTWDTFDVYPDWANPPHNESEMEEYRRLGEMAYMDKKKEQAIAEVSEHRARFVLSTARRIVFTWTGYWSLSRAYLRVEPFAWFNVFLTLALTGTAGLGFVRAYKRFPSRTIVFAWLFLAFPAVYYVTHPSMAYRHPLDPFLLLFTAYAFVGYRSQNGKAAGDIERSRREAELTADFNARTTQARAVSAL